MSDYTTDNSSSPDPLGPILEEFLARLRQGERPSLDDFALRYPDHAEEIQELFPPLVQVEMAGEHGASHLQVPGADEARGGAIAGDGADARFAHEFVASQPNRLGDYRIVREIGGGGMGIVYEAEREALSSRVALKVIHPKYRSRPEYLRWFLHEARTAASLHHTNIVSVFDYGDHEGVCYYAMQFIAGHSLDRIFQDVRRLKQEAQANQVAGKKASHGELKSETSPLEPTQSAEASVDLAMRSVSIGLLRGEFEAAQPAPTSKLAALMADRLGETEAIGGDATSGESDQPRPVQSLGAQEGEEASLASSNLSSAAGSSWRTSSSARYQREIARIGAQVADALDYAHKRKVIHRDIKPHNILLDALGNAWITDFGLAKLKQAEDESTARALGGTLRYMAPERFQGISDGRDDIYALGATLYEFLALRPIFEAHDPARLLGQIEHNSPTRLREIDRQIHPDLAAIVAKTLAKNPADRFETPAELRDELRRFIEGRPVKTRPVPAYSRLLRWCKREPWLAGANIAAAVMTMVLAAVSTIAAWTYREQRNDLQFEQLRTKAQLSRAEHAERKVHIELDRTTEAERQARLALGQSLISEGAALQRTGLIGQRFESLTRLSNAARVFGADHDGRQRLSEIRNHAIAALGLTDLHMRRQHDCGPMVFPGVRHYVGA
jgi:serine/threonine protein kinase